MIKKIVALCVVWACASGVSAVRADTIVFKNGDEIDGKIIEKDDVSIKVELDAGTVVVPMVRVRRIEADTPEKIEEREKRKEAALELAKQMKEEGKVLYKGKWVTENEKKEDEDKIAAAKKKKKELADEAKKKADEAAKKQQELDDKAAAELAKQNTGNSREDRFSRRHGREGLSNDVMNQNSSNSNGYNSTIINNNGYRGGQ